MRPPAISGRPLARGTAWKTNPPIAMMQAVIASVVAAVEPSTPDRYALAGSGVVLIRLSTPSCRSVASFAPRLT